MELTRREREVAELVAEGLTNKAIAERLFLSERTVEGHVEHALGKLGMDSRAQLAAWVATGGAGGGARREVRLPAQLTRFVGRGREVSELGELLAKQRLVTLTGPGGVGKTRLALVVASTLPRYANVGLADLSGVDDARHVRTELEAALPARPDAATLLVVDNCEHVVEAAATAVDELLRTTAVTVLATSREALRVAGESVVSVAPLEAVEAVELFLDRAAPGTATAETAAAISARLDRLPLALELAAARTHLMPAAALADSLASSLEILTSGPRTAPERQRRLDASIAWSYRLLAPEEQRAFRALGVIAGSFTLPAATAIAAVPAEVVLALAERSLLSVDSEGRHRLLFPVREFARRELAAAGEVGAAERRHDEWVVALGERLRPLLLVNSAGAQRELWAERELAWPALERLESRDPDAFVSLALSFGYAGYRRVGARELDTLMKRALSVATPSHADFALLQFGAAVGAGQVGDRGRQTMHARLLLDLAEASGDRVMVARALLMLSFAAGFLEHDHGRATRLLERALEAVTGLDPGIETTVRNNLAFQYHRLGEFEKGAEHARAAIALGGEQSGGRADFLDSLARNLLGAGRVDEAHEVALEAARAAQRSRRDADVTFVLDLLAAVERARGRTARAATLAAAADRSWDREILNEFGVLRDESLYAELAAAEPEATARGRALERWEALEWALREE